MLQICKFIFCALYLKQTIRVIRMACEVPDVIGVKVGSGRKKTQPDDHGLHSPQKNSRYYFDFCAPSLAPRNSLFIRAIFDTEIFLGHSASQAYVLVQFPKPSSSIFATIA